MYIVWNHFHRKFLTVFGDFSSAIDFAETFEKKEDAEKIADKFNKETLLPHTVVEISNIKDSCKEFYKNLRKAYNG